jgi:hypothetical protein
VSASVIGSGYYIARAGRDIQKELVIDEIFFVEGEKVFLQVVTNGD